MIFETDDRYRCLELIAFLSIKPRKALEAGLKKQVGLTYPQFGALFALRGRRGLSQKALAGILETDTTNMMVICDSLEKKGFLRRETARGDRRSNSLAVTALGEKALARALPIAGEAYAPLFDALSGKEYSRLLSLLEKLRGAWLAREI